MSTINTHISIPKNISTKDDLDFDFLKEKGIEYIEQLGGSLWTDFNSHDPGITMLEMLSYAITDLGMRINMPIENLLASTDKTKNLNAQFYKASEIFPTKPVTALDYRKLFIDIDGVKNCWLTTHKKTVYANCKNDELSYNKEDFSDIKTDFKREFVLNGLYDVLIDLDEGKTIKEIEKLVQKKYHANRNLCEDLICVSEVPEQMISVCANIEVEKTADEELVYAKISLAIDNYFSPSLSFYSIQQMLEKEYTPDQIFDGPILNNGFIDIEELKSSELKEEVRLSDIMKIIMNIEGVKLIKDISIGNCDDTKTTADQWNICIAKGKKPALCKMKSSFNFNKGVLPLNINNTQVAIYLAQLKQDVVKAQENAKDNKELTLPKSKSFKVESYTTIQNDFPDTYGISLDGLTARATTKRKSQAKQLKGYLLFFDQILANYFQHLGKVKDLLSVIKKDEGYKINCIDKPTELQQTFFAQVVKDIKGFDELVTDYPTNDNELLTKKIFEQFDDNVIRGNQILDHLLARFAEKFGEYSFIMKTIYGYSAEKIVLENKKAFLADYKVISSERGAGFNYYKQKPKDLWNTDNISGVQKRIARLMGIKNYDRRTLSKSFVEIYDLKNSNDDTVFRWRIRDTKKQIILSGTTEYASVSAASKELYFSILQIIESDEKKVLKAFKKDANGNITNVKDHTIIDNFYIHQADSGKYSFHIIDPTFKISSVDYIIAKQYKYYSNLEDLKDAILASICFMKDQFSEEGIFLIEHILLRPEITECKTQEPKLETEIAVENKTLIENRIAVEVEEVINEITIIDVETEVVVQDKTKFLPICTDNCTDTCSIDPYSYKVSIVLPGYTFRFSNPDFRNYMETIIKEELPSHILPKICWVGHRKGNIDNKNKEYLQQLETEKKDGLELLDKEIIKIQNSDLSQGEKDIIIAKINNQKTQLIAFIDSKKDKFLLDIKNKKNDLVEFEKAYKIYLNKKTKLLQKQPKKELKKLIETISELNTIYPTGRLLDCDDESDEVKGRIILGQTNLGTL